MNLNTSTDFTPHELYKFGTSHSDVWQVACTCNRSI